MRKGCDIALTIIPLLLAVGVMTVFHACDPMEDGMWMNCHYVQLGIFGIGLALAALGIANVLISNGRTRLVIRAISILLAIITILLPGTIVRMCMMDTMRCQMLMKPFTYVMCGLFIILQVTAMVLDKKDNGNKETAR